MELSVLILQKLESIDARLDAIDARITEVKKDTGKMSKHINFVDNVYTKVKIPFHYMCDIVDQILLRNNNEIKQVKD
jgi:hypothetical protein